MAAPAFNNDEERRLDIAYDASRLRDDVQRAQDECLHAFTFRRRPRGFASPKQV